MQSGDDGSAASGLPPTPFTPYQRRLLVFLSVATFFEGYDFFALAQILPNLRADMGLSETGGGWLLAVIGIGTILAYGVVRLADRFGRRVMLMITILGYTLFTFATAFAQTPYDFAICQIAARIFLIGEISLGMVYAAEAFPADRRGHAIGIIQASSALGAIACAAVAPLLLATTWGWRAVFLVGIVPLLLLAYARRGLRETERFAAHAAAGVPRRALRDILRSAHRGRILQLALIWALLFMCAQNAVFFWKEFAVAERGFSDREVGSAFAIAAIVSLPPLFLVGRALDAWGRRPAAAVIFLGMAVSVVAAYQLRSLPLLTAALAVFVFCVAAAFTVMNSFTTELFPTDCRAEAFAWANNLLGRSGYVFGPAIAGAAAGAIGWSNAISLTALCPLAALVLILWLLPETKGRQLD
jgi:MFS transporter, putative metabolite:H+ symporter